MNAMRVMSQSVRSPMFEKKRSTRAFRMPANLSANTSEEFASQSVVWLAWAGPQAAHIAGVFMEVLFEYINLRPLERF
jgi:hypothetical protein